MAIKKTLQTEEHPFQTWECSNSLSLVPVEMRVTRNAVGYAEVTTRTVEMGIASSFLFGMKDTTEDQIDALCYALFGPEVKRGASEHLISDYLRACGWEWRKSESTLVE